MSMMNRFQIWLSIIARGCTQRQLQQLEDMEQAVVRYLPRQSRYAAGTGSGAGSGAGAGAAAVEQQQDVEELQRRVQEAAGPAARGAAAAAGPARPAAVARGASAAGVAAATGAAAAAGAGLWQQQRVGPGVTLAPSSRHILDPNLQHQHQHQHQQEQEQQHSAPVHPQHEQST